MEHIVLRSAHEDLVLPSAPDRQAAFAIAIEELENIGLGPDIAVTVDDGLNPVVACHVEIIVDDNGATIAASRR